MHKWLSYANEYVRQSDWKDLALIKLCLCSAGVLIGMSLAKRVISWRRLAQWPYLLPPIFR